MKHPATLGGFLPLNEVSSGLIGRDPKADLKEVPKNLLLPPRFRLRNGFLLAPRLRLMSEVRHEICFLCSFF